MYTDVGITTSRRCNSNTNNNRIDVFPTKMLELLLREVVNGRNNRLHLMQKYAKQQR